MVEEITNQKGTIPKMKAPQQELINAMEAERTQRQLDHKAFSALLQITDSYWCMIRKGKRRPSLALCQTICDQLPDVASHVDAYMRQGNEE